MELKTKLESQKNQLVKKPKPDEIQSDNQRNN